MTRIITAEYMGSLDDWLPLDLQKESIDQLQSELAQKRKKVILERFKAVTGFELDFDAEKKRRFNRLAIEFKANQETVWFNDGSEDGIRIVTFIKNDTSFDPKLDPLKLSIEYTYF